MELKCEDPPTGGTGVLGVLITFLFKVKQKSAKSNSDLILLYLLFLKRKVVAVCWCSHLHGAAHFQNKRGIWVWIRILSSERQTRTSPLIVLIQWMSSYDAWYDFKLLFLGWFISKNTHQGDKYSLLSQRKVLDYFLGGVLEMLRRWLVNGRLSFLSLRQGQEDVLHQHGADHHLLAVDRQLSGAFVFGCHGDQHQAAARHRPACKPVDRVFRRRRRRRSTEVKAAKVRRWSHRIRRTHAD